MAAAFGPRSDHQLHSNLIRYYQTECKLGGNIVPAFWCVILIKLIIYQSECVKIEHLFFCLLNDCYTLPRLESFTIPLQNSYLLIYYYLRTFPRPDSLIPNLLLILNLPVIRILFIILILSVLRKD